MTQTIYGMLPDGGDGSCSIWWFREKPDVNRMEELYPDTWGCSEGIAQTLTFPDDIDLEKCGFSFSTMADVFWEGYEND